MALFIFFFQLAGICKSAGVDLVGGRKNSLNFGVALEKGVDEGILIEGECCALVEVCALPSAIVVNYASVYLLNLIWTFTLYLHGRAASC